MLTLSLTLLSESNQNLYEIKSSLLYPTTVALAAALPLAADPIKLNQVTIFYPFSLHLHVS